MYDVHPAFTGRIVQQSDFCKIVADVCDNGRYKLDACESRRIVRLALPLKCAVHQLTSPCMHVQYTNNNNNNNNNNYTHATRDTKTETSQCASLAIDCESTGMDTESLESHHPAHHMTRTLL